MSTYDAAQKKYYRSGKKAKARYLRKYGITMAQGKEMWASQGGLCRCCGKYLKWDCRDTVTDHCHDTGRVRGILCRSCNMAIGQLGDDLRGVKQAVAYLS